MQCKKRLHGGFVCLFGFFRGRWVHVEIQRRALLMSAAVFAGRYARFLAECAVERADALKATAEGNLLHSLVCERQSAHGGGAEAMLEVLRQEAAKIGVTLEITATDRTTMTSMRNDETLYDAYFTTFSSVAVPSLRNFLSADYAGWSDDEHLQELMLQMTTAATKEAAFATWEEIQYYCYSDYCPILMMGHFHQAAACTNRLTGYNVFLTTNFWNAKLAK